MSRLKSPPPRLEKRMPPDAENWGTVHCQNCDWIDSEEEFTPSDGNLAPLICPECGSTNCFLQSQEDLENLK